MHPHKHKKPVHQALSVDTYTWIDGYKYINYLHNNIRAALRIDDLTGYPPWYLTAYEDDLYLVQRGFREPRTLEHIGLEESTLTSYIDACDIRVLDILKTPFIDYCRL